MNNIALILIDIQQGFDDIEYWGGERNNPNAEENCRQILERFRKLSLAIFHIQHSSTDPNSPMHVSHKGFAFKPQVKPIAGEIIIEKQVNSAFIGTNLRSLLRKQNITELIIVGLTTDHCVSTTSRMAGNFGFDTIVISDATATFNKIGINGDEYDAELIHHTALASLKDEFASVKSTKDILEYIK